MTFIDTKMYKYEIRAMRPNLDGSISFDRRTRYFDEVGQELQLSSLQSNWTKTIYPKIGLDLVLELTQKGETLDPDFIVSLETLYEPGIKTLWTEDYVKNWEKGLEGVD